MQLVCLLLLVYLPNVGSMLAIVLCVIFGFFNASHMLSFSTRGGCCSAQPDRHFGSDRERHHVHCRRHHDQPSRCPHRHGNCKPALNRSLLTWHNTRIFRCWLRWRLRSFSLCFIKETYPRIVGQQTILRLRHSCGALLHRCDPGGNHYDRQGRPRLRPSPLRAW